MNNTISIRVFFRTIFNVDKMIEKGWKRVGENYFEQERGNYKLTYIIRSIQADTKYSELNCILNTQRNNDVVKYTELEGFEFEDAWKVMWQSNCTPSSIEILFNNKLKSKLISSGWEDCFIQDGLMYGNEYASFLYMDKAPEGNELSKVCDDNPVSTMQYINVLKTIGIIQI